LSGFLVEWGFSLRIVHGIHLMTVRPAAMRDGLDRCRSAAGRPRLIPSQETTAE